MLMQLLLIYAQNVVIRFYAIERVVLGSNLSRCTTVFVFVIKIARLLVHTAPIHAQNLCANAAVAARCTSMLNLWQAGMWAQVQYLVPTLEKNAFFCPLGRTTLGNLLFALYNSTKKVV